MLGLESSLKQLTVQHVLCSSDVVLKRPIHINDLVKWSCEFTLKLLFNTVLVTVSQVFVSQFLEAVCYLGPDCLSLCSLAEVYE
jgi:hypothetical protein